jgi:deoxyribodipyrimidine photolyase-related protein
MNKVAIVFPHHLFEDNPVLMRDVGKVFLVEEDLFFNQYAFHKQKLVFHRASMKHYETWLKDRGYDVEYVEAQKPESDVRRLVENLVERGRGELVCVDPSDDWLGQRLKEAAGRKGVKLELQDSPMFINRKQEIDAYFQGKKSLRQTDFYIHQRKSLGILLDSDSKPLGGKWTYDTENRKKYPKGQTPPTVDFPPDNSYYREAGDYVERHFASHYGEINKDIRYPIDFDASQRWLDDFLENRLNGFGTYQDAIVTHEHWLHHSLLSPMLNSGLITPSAVVDRTLEYAREEEVPMNALEGFLRQIVGWREFIRAVYELKGRGQRTTNFWGFSRRLPESFWKGETGILPVDTTIKKVLDTGYAHHIERLMVLGNFMLLCEFDPDEVYRWFMELFVDAYDWVMVPNVYGMSQFADGGVMSSKPYISSSNYLMKMGNFPKGPWQKTWDALFWRFMDNHRGFFSGNPRMRMLIRTYDKMNDQKKQEMQDNANLWLDGISG